MSAAFREGRGCGGRKGACGERRPVAATKGRPLLASCAGARTRTGKRAGILSDDMQVMVAVWTHSAGVRSLVRQTTCQAVEVWCGRNKAGYVHLRTLHL